MFRRKPKTPIRCEWLVVGLGNPGSEYSGTRHNVGFEVVDRLSRKLGAKLDKSKHRARFGTALAEGVGIVIAKPMTYMNLSGQAVAPLLREFGLEPDRLVIVADETDLPLGRIRIRTSGSPGGHNGHKSISQSLRTQDYPRIRLGIGRVDKSETIDHVLGAFEFDERKEADEMIDRAVEAVICIVRDGLDGAMNEYNR